jgi:hypothetical protein
VNASIVRFAAANSSAVSVWIPVPRGSSSTVDSRLLLFRLDLDHGFFLSVFLVMFQSPCSVLAHVIHRVLLMQSCKSIYVSLVVLIPLSTSEGTFALSRRNHLL